MRLEQTRIYVRAEEERAASVQTRGAAAAATSALVLSLMVTIGRSLFGERDLSGLVFGFSFESGLRLAYVLALLSLLVSGFLAGAALWPPGSTAASVEEVQDFADRRPESREEVARELVSSLAVQLASTRKSNDGKTRVLRWALGFLVVGVLAAALLAATLGLTRPVAPEALTGVVLGPTPNPGWQP